MGAAIGIPRRRRRSPRRLAEVHPPRHKAQGQVGAHPHERQGGEGSQTKLAPDQGARRLRAPCRRSSHHRRGTQQRGHRTQPRRDRPKRRPRLELQRHRNRQSLVSPRRSQRLRRKSSQNNFSREKRGTRHRPEFLASAKNCPQRGAPRLHPAAASLLRRKTTQRGRLDP